MILKRIRTSKISKVLSVMLIMSICNSLFQLNSVFAVTGGPNAPEFQSFTPIGVTDMVDPFSGNFMYNIPLFEVPGPNGGYPLNLSYQSDITMEQEASWVGLGWNLNAGSIQRQVRGVPDDFNGKIITKTLDMEPSYTIGGRIGGGMETKGNDNNKGVLGVNINIYFNNKTGWGMGTGMQVNMLSKDDEGLKLIPGFSINSDSQNGSTISVGASLAHRKGDVLRAFSGGLTLGSSSGIDLSLGVSYTKDNFTQSNNNDNVDYEVKTALRGSSMFSFSTSKYIPAIPHEYKGISFSGTFQVGFSNLGIDPYASVTMFYTKQSIKEKEQKLGAYGYMYLGEGVTHNKRILDYHREKEGLLGEKSPNLGMPHIQYDVYSVQGQGISGMFRPYRTDIGILSDPKYSYKTHGIDLGANLGIGVAITPPSFIPVPNVNKWGADGEKSVTEASQGIWPDDYKQPLSDLAFKNNNNELIYYKMHGEYTVYDSNVKNYIGGDDPVFIPITSKEGEISPHLKKSDNTTVGLPLSQKRMNTNTVITALKNKELVDNKKYDVEGVDYENRTVTIGKTKDVTTYVISDDIGGYIITQQDGTRYFYNLPVYNLSQEELLFSVAGVTNDNRLNGRIPVPFVSESNNSINYQRDDTDKYLEYTQTPAYATSYLLTAIVGADYVDVDGNGPSDDDYGYWVRFNYDKKHDYSWRAPFSGAILVAGAEAIDSDDKAAFSYGVREQYYLKSIETTTHKAVFTLDFREDAYGATYRGERDDNSKSYKLQTIDLYTKQELADNQVNPTPIKSVHFTHNNNLCQNVYNNPANGGKLTLEKLHFTYGNSLRGAQSPYVFEYGVLPNDSEPVSHNYSPTNIDRWGHLKIQNFHSSETVEKNNIVFPHNVQSVSQISGMSEQEFKNLKQEEATIWQLTDIHVPSGGKIKVEYEQDEYAYVQHQKAQQIFFVDNAEQNLHKNWNEKSESENFEQRKVFFKLKHPVSGNYDADKLYTEYIAPIKRDGEYNMYFKVKLKLFSNPDMYEYISGYAELETDNSTKKAICGIDETRLSDDGYTHAYVVVKPIKICKIDNASIGCKTPKYYHPFVVAAWQHIRLTMMHKVHSSGGMDLSNFEGKGKTDKISFF